MAAFMPAWRAFDDAHSVRVLSKRPFGGGSVALCVAPSLAGAKEGPRLALSMVQRWVEQGRSVILADGHIGRPSLHGLVGVENKEGLAELLLVGADWQALAVPTPVPGLRLIPAGGHAAPSEPDAVRERLASLCQSTEEAGQTLALFVPLGSMVAEWAVEECRDILVLSNKGERTLHFFSVDEDRIRARVGPPAKEVPADEAPPAAPPSTTPSATAAVGPAPAAAAGEPTAEMPVSDTPEEDMVSHPPFGTEEPELPLWDASEGFLTPRDQGASHPTRRGKDGAAAVEDSWAAYAARLRAKSGEGTSAEAASEGAAANAAAAEGRTSKGGASEGGTSKAGTRPPPGARPARYPAQAPPFPADSAPLSDVPPEIPPPPVARPKPALTPWEPEETEADGESEAFEDFEPFDDLVETGRFGGDRRKLLVRVAAIAAVAVVGVAGGWIFTSLRDRPPVEVQGVMPPRSAVGEGGAGVAAPAEAEATPDAPEEGAGATPTPSGAAPGDATPEGTAGAATPAREEPRAAAPAPAPGTGGPVGPATSAPHQRFTWSLAAMGSYSTAASMVDRLRQRAPGEAFAIAPIVSDGRTLYRVLGGTAETRDALLATREAMARTAGMAPETPFPREAPMAYAVADYPVADQARARAEVLARAGVPTYVLEVARDDGSRAYRVYAGAYASEAEAQPLLALLRGAGVSDAVFTERRGRVPPS